MHRKIEGVKERECLKYQVFVGRAGTVPTLTYYTLCAPSPSFIYYTNTPSHRSPLPTYPTGVPARLLAYAKTVAHFPTALKEFEWRNKFWLDRTRARTAAGKPDLTPFHTELLMKAKDNGHVKFD
jgi:hypothetical protein